MIITTMIISINHTAFNLPYGASKGALDRIVLAAAEELRDKRGVEIDTMVRINAIYLYKQKLKQEK